MTRCCPLVAGQIGGAGQIVYAPSIVRGLAGAIALKARVKRKAPRHRMLKSCLRLGQCRHRRTGEFRTGVSRAEDRRCNTAFPANIVELSRENDEFVDAKNGGRKKIRRLLFRAAFVADSRTSLQVGATIDAELPRNRYDGWCGSWRSALDSADSQNYSCNND
jgi:hypothetical protein